MANNNVELIEIIKGDLLDATTDFICHQCNCVTKKGKGLSKAIFDKYPESNIYAPRLVNNYKDEPGTIKVINNVINIIAQYYPGKSRYANDTKEKRIEWFQTALDEINETYDGTYTFAFPYRIGCGLAGGDWNVYYDMIKDFANKGNKVVKIYQLF